MQLPNPAPAVGHARGTVHLVKGGEGGEGHARVERNQGGEGGEGGEGGKPSQAKDEAAFLTDVAFMEGHLRAGMALYRAGDLAAAKTHMGHPLEEKFAAVEHPLEERGFGDLEDLIDGLMDAAEDEKPVDQVAALFDKITARTRAVHEASPGGPAAALRSLALLTRIAAEEYAEGTEGGKVSNLHEYQDAWGFMRAVEAEAEVYAASGNASVAEAARAILAQVRTTDPAFGDLQGQGQMEMDAALLYGAAARMEIAALAVK
ncbi:MAG: hypothetical protein KDC18_07915 [Alphaproteobacteria bacterium]|nr:hypothetical protein [Alphaproteobacteria bacterium]MCB9929522.1 hypothetical protein [Alphaproteobacteria bacterium]